MDKKGRSAALAASRQVIIKAGTRLLIDREAVARLVAGVAEIRRSGRRVLLVTSGAVGMGMETLKIKTRPRDLARIQALAAVGQSALMAIYTSECRKNGFEAAQLLLTAADLRNRERCLNVMNCINALWENGVLPIVNENDSVSVDELKFGDNDTLAGLLGSLTGSELTILLTTVDGLRDRDAAGNLGERISEVAKLTDDILGLAGGTDDSKFSIGGMESKLRAAGIVTSAGGYLWIADGRDPGVIKRILAGDDTGTLFLPRGRRLSGHKRWFTFFSKVSGRLTVDAGAERAIRERGKSLLPAGITDVSGEFKRGDTVEIAGPGGKPFARGLVNYASADCLKLRGCHSDAVQAAMGSDCETEMVHRDNLTLL